VQIAFELTFVILDYLSAFSLVVPVSAIAHSSLLN